MSASDAPPPSSAGAPPSPAFIAASTGLVFAGHLVLWARVAGASGKPFSALLLGWDGAHYATILREGYRDALWVFYPGYPMLVRGLAALLRVDAVEWLGFGVSTACFVGFAALVACALPGGGPVGLTPTTRLGWLAFLLSPASYVFHSLHTESLFLVLSFGAFVFAARRRPVLAGLLAAASALVRNQGVFVGLCVALLAALGETETRRRLRAFVTAGALAACGVVGFLLFQALASGDAFTFLRAQQGWAHVDSPMGSLKALVFANPWQSTDGQNVARYLGWLAFVALGVWLMRRSPALGLYALLCSLVQLAQGEFVNAWRFAAPVFPLFFFAGDLLARRPRLVQLAALAALAALNLDTARRYALGLWAY